MTSVDWHRIGQPRLARKIAVGLDGSLYALNEDKSLWVSKTGGIDGSWQRVRNMDSNTVNITCAAGMIYYQKNDRSLWHISRNGEQIHSLGRPYAASEIAGTEDLSLDFSILWALNDDKTLWRNGSSGSDNHWIKVGRPQQAHKIAASHGTVFALNTNGSFWWGGGKNGTWERIGTAKEAIEIAAASKGQSDEIYLYALNKDYSLWQGIIT